MKKASLRGVARDVANKLNEEHNQTKESHMKAMGEQAAKRLEELERMKTEQMEGLKKR